MEVTIIWINGSKYYWIIESKYYKTNVDYNKGMTIVWLKKDLAWAGVKEWLG